MGQGDPDRAEQAFLRVVGGIVLTGAVTVAGLLVFWQVFTWLKTSTWKPMSLISALKWMGVEWAHWPHDWLGLHGLLDGIPLFIGLIALAFVGLVVMISNSNGQRS